MSSPARLVFVGGVHRSGTTLLARVLAGHPAVSGFSGTGAPEDEGQHLQTVLPTALGYRTFPRRRRTFSREVLAALGGPGKFGFRSWGHLTETSPLASEENARVLREEWGRHWDASKPFLVEKSPPNLLRTRLLRRLFPESYFLIMVRHPVAVSYSTKQLRRVPLSLFQLVRHWLHCHELFVDDVRGLDRVLVVRYERLLARPDEVLAQVSRFLGLPPPALAVRPRESTNEVHFRRFARLAEGRLSGLYVRALARRYEAPVRRFGYSLRDLSLVARDTVLDVSTPADGPTLSS